MKRVVLGFIAISLAFSVFAQNRTVTMTAEQAKNAEADAHRQAATLQQSELRIEALGDAIKSLRANKGNDKEIVVLEQLLEETKRDFKIARDAYSKTLDFLNGVNVEKRN